MPTGIPPVQLIAGETNYPPGSNTWSGQPIKITPALDYGTPNTRPPAQTFNYWINLLTQQDLTTQNLLVSEAIANFDTVIPGSAIDLAGGITLLPFFFWQPYSQKWIALVQRSAPNVDLFGSHDNGRSWTVEAFGIGAGTAIAACSSLLPPPPLVGSANYVIIANASGATSSYNQVGTNTAIGSTGITTPSAVFPQGSGFAFLGLSLSGSTYTGWYYTSNALATSWSSGTSGLPLTWQSGTCHVNGVVSCQSTAATDGSGPRTLVAMCATSAGTDHGRLLVVTPSGGFVDTQPTFLLTKCVTGVAYGANDNLWGVLCRDTSNSYLYTNPDPTNASGWTLAHTFAGFNLCDGLAVLGYVWAAQVANASDNRIMYSSDVGADGASSQWGTANASLTGGLTVAATPGSMQSSGFGLVAWGGTNVHFSRQLGAMPSGAF